MIAVCDDNAHCNERHDQEQNEAFAGHPGFVPCVFQCKCQPCNWRCYNTYEHEICPKLFGCDISRRQLKNVTRTPLKQNSHKPHKRSGSSSMAMLPLVPCQCSRDQCRNNQRYHVGCELIGHSCSLKIKY